MSEVRSELDVRWPIGLLFALVGLALAAYGTLSSPSAFERPLGINLDLWWGLVMLLFGVAMVWGARRASRREQ